MSRPERRRGRGAAGLSELARLLSERDLAVLDLIAQHRFLTTKQVHAYCFHDHTSTASGSRICRRVLLRLEQHGLLERPIRRVGGLQAGSASSVWMLSSMGQRLRNLRDGVGAVGRCASQANASSVTTSPSPTPT
jgi:Replication-relaxation